MPEENLSKLFNLASELYVSKFFHLKNRLLAIRHSSLIDNNIESSVDFTLNYLNKHINEIEDIKKKEMSFVDKFKSIREVETQIRKEELILTLLEDVTDTFVSNRSLSTALSNLFEYIYYGITGEKLPFLVTSKGGTLETYTSLKNDDNEIVVGTIGMPLYSDSYLYEWILAGHELGHILANKIFGTQIEYTDNIEENYKMELLCDRIALRVLGPVYLEALSMKLTGEQSTKKSPYFESSSRHPPESWRIWMCYYDALSFEFDEAEPFISSIKSIINHIYSRPEDTTPFNKIKNELNTEKYDLNKIRNIDELKECYHCASILSYKWMNDGYDSSDINSYYPDQIVVAGYLSFRSDIKRLELYTQYVINSLICINNN